MHRLYWNLRTGLAGGYFLAADNCSYFISIVNNNTNIDCQIMDGFFTPIGKPMRMIQAKRKIRAMLIKERER